MKRQYTYRVTMVYIASDYPAMRRKGTVRASSEERALDAFRDSIRADFPGQSVWFPDKFGDNPGHTIELG